MSRPADHCTATRSMSVASFAAAILMTIVTLALVVTPPNRQ